MFQAKSIIIQFYKSTLFLAAHHVNCVKKRKVTKNTTLEYYVTPQQMKPCCVNII